MAANTIRDIKLDTNGDWSITEGDLDLVRGGDAIVQAIKIRLQFFKTEWFLNTEAGTPWFQSILVKNPDANVLQTIFRERILGTPGVDELTSLNLSFDSAARSLAVSFRVSTNLGELDGSVEI